MPDSRFSELDAAAERATLRRERVQLLDRLGPAAHLVSAAIAAGERGDWSEARKQLVKAELLLQLILDEAADRILVDDANQARAEQFSREIADEEHFND